MGGAERSRGLERLKDKEKLVAAYQQALVACFGSGLRMRSQSLFMAEVLLGSRPEAAGAEFQTRTSVPHVMGGACTL